ncbi:MAG: hypothetical protein IT373_11210, partial [Polyangiaceae bacterium]|nr:hypothetical protein [Polyangiaceae bacterium]
ALAACAPTATAGRRGAAYESAALRAIGEDDVQRAFDERPELAPRVRVAIYAREPAKAARVAERLRADPSVTSTYVIAPLVLTEELRGWSETEGGDGGGGRVSLRALRLLAARARADVLLLVDEGERVRRDANGLAAFGIAFLPLLFVPFQDVAVESWLDLYLVDTLSGFLYGQASADRRATDEFLTIYSQRDRELVQSAFDELLPVAAERLGEVMARERSRTAPAAAPRRGGAFALESETADPWRHGALVLGIAGDGTVSLDGVPVASRDELLLRLAALARTRGPAPSATVYADPELPSARLLALADDLERLGFAHLRFVPGAAPPAAPPPPPPAPSTPAPYTAPELKDPFSGRR